MIFLRPNLHTETLIVGITFALILGSVSYEIVSTNIKEQRRKSMSNIMQIFYLKASDLVGEITKALG